MEPTNILFAFGLTLFAGLATGIGSALAFFTKQTNVKFLSLALGLAAGVMIYVSFMEIFSKGQESLVSILTERSGTFWMLVSFFGGMLLIGVIDRLVPTIENPHTIYRVEELDETPQKSGLIRMGILTAVAIAIHNFPEGLATFTAAVYDLRLSIPIAVAIAIHNVPEGIAVSIPIYYVELNRYAVDILAFS
jgi:ZIP family zinc transporter